MHGEKLTADNRRNQPSPNNIHDADPQNDIDPLNGGGIGVVRA